MSEEFASFFEPDDPLPFEHLFSKLVLNARTELRRRTDFVVYELLALEAHAAWERYLLMRLTAASAHAAHWQFQIFKSVRSAFRARRSSDRLVSDLLYCEFIGDNPEDRLRKLFVEFPFLAKLCGALVANWIATVAEFLTRLSADRGELPSHFAAIPISGPIIALRTGISDPHRGGRSVVDLDFENGARIIYKPRSLVPESHFSALLDWMNESGSPHVLQSASCWVRDGYGWMEYIEQRPCETRTAIHDFFWRSGALLGLCYLARGVDFHRENMIAAGEYPVLIDLEALGHPQNPGTSQSGTLADSILRTGFLPRGIPSHRRTYDWGALSRIFHTDRRGSTWVRINRDDMALHTGSKDFRNPGHLPRFDFHTYLATDFVPDVQAGFEWVGEHLLDDSEQRAKLASWIRNLAECTRRQIFRPTAMYQEAITRLTLPKFLRSGEAPPDLMPDNTAVGEAQKREELDALMQMDIPYFSQQDRGDSLSGWHDCLPSLPSYLEQTLLIVEALAFTESVG